MGSFTSWVAKSFEVVSFIVLTVFILLIVVGPVYVVMHFLMKYW